MQNRQGLKYVKRHGMCDTWQRYGRKPRQGSFGHAFYTRSWTRARVFHDGWPQGYGSCRVNLIRHAGCGASASGASCAISRYDTLRKIFFPNYEFPRWIYLFIFCLSATRTFESDSMKITVSKYPTCVRSSRRDGGYSSVRKQTRVSPWYDLSHQVLPVCTRRLLLARKGRRHCERAGTTLEPSPWN